LLLFSGLLLFVLVNLFRLGDRIHRPLRGWV
jgi:hypothetical protein